MFPACLLQLTIVFSGGPKRVLGKRVADASPEWMMQYMAEVNKLPAVSTVDDVKRVLHKLPLPRISITPMHAELVDLAVAASLPLVEIDATAATHKSLEDMLLKGYNVRQRGVSEASRATIHDVLTGEVWTTLSEETGALQFESDRDHHDRTGATVSDTGDGQARPDYLGWAGDVLIIKVCKHQLQIAPSV